MYHVSWEVQIYVLFPGRREAVHLVSRKPGSVQVLLPARSGSVCVLFPGMTVSCVCCSFEASV